MDKSTKTQKKIFKFPHQSDLAIEIKYNRIFDNSHICINGQDNGWEWNNYGNNGDRSFHRKVYWNTKTKVGYCVVQGIVWILTNWANAMLIKYPHNSVNEWLIGSNKEELEKLINNKCGVSFYAIDRLN